ncbi:hypothetical protein A7W90_17515 [Clostridium sp. Bc-iso-3]|nr:hypothetical protein A7W90_17515 [Clostridium sp. Bc-iso-3]
MKKKKNLTMLLSFCIGAALFMSTAFADVVSKTGYDQLKDAIKKTVASVSEEYDSFTMEMALSIKDNDKVLVANSEIARYDMANSRMENITTSELAGSEKESFYSYRDNWCSMYYNSNDADTYYVNEYESEDKDAVTLNNFFEDKDAEYIEKIFDALIGNLKEYVIVGENPEGSKEFSGRLSDGQIPALVNAVTAYAAKQSVFDRTVGYNEFDMPSLKNDVFVKEISGRANVNADGIIENLFGEFILAGSEKDGTKHELKVELVFKVYNINSTAVVKPDLTGKKVEKSIVHTTPYGYVSEKYLGKWKNDIIIEENDRFVKIGERVIEITGINDDYVYGTYTEIYKEEYAHYGSDSKKYSLKVDMYDNKGELEVTDDLGNVIVGYMYLDMGRIECYIPSENPAEDGIVFNSSDDIIYNSSFYKVFEE